MAITLSHDRRERKSGAHNFLEILAKGQGERGLLNSGIGPIEGMAMSILAIITGSLLKPTVLPADPDPAMVAFGSKVAARHRPISDVLRRDRVALGKWFDGHVQREVEFAIWLSPDLLARWMGYRRAAEGWAEGEMEKRWLRLRGEMGDHRWFVVQLGCFERQDPLEVFSPKRPPVERLDAPTIECVTSGRASPVNVLGSANLYSRDATKLASVDWVTTTEALDFLRPAKSPLIDPGYPLGWNRLRVFVIDAGPGIGAITLTVRAPEKTWTARFSPVRG